MSWESAMMLLASLNAAGIFSLLTLGVRWWHHVELRLDRIEREIKLTAPGGLI